jgi:integrase
MKARRSNFTRWLGGLSKEERAAHLERARHAQWGPKRQPLQKVTSAPWKWPLDIDRYDRSKSLTKAELKMLDNYAEAYRFYRYGRTMDFGSILDRLVRPLRDVFDYTGIPTAHKRHTLHFLLREMQRRKSPFWTWNTAEWVESVDARRESRQHVVAAGYLLCGFSELHLLKSDHIVYGCLARKVFGKDHMERLAERVVAVLTKWGYLNPGLRRDVLRTLAEALLFKRFPHLEGLTIEDLRVISSRRKRQHTRCMVLFSRVLANFGVLPEALEIRRTIRVKKNMPSLTIDVPAEWARCCQLWFERSTVTMAVRRKNYYFLLNVGRWLKATHPDINSPAGWTRETAAEAVAVICNWRGGDWSSASPAYIKSRGKILAASTRAGRLCALRMFFRDLQEWEMIPRRFDPRNSFRTPKSVLALVEPNPRIIADDIWAKLVWAGLNLNESDLPSRVPHMRTVPKACYPMELVRALITTWLFAGLRINEIVRLRLGCIRWQQIESVESAASTGERIPGDSVCLLDVPLNKTGKSFSKAVDNIVGEAISAWEKVRPQQIRLPDTKTGELVHFLFLYRLTRVGKQYMNKTLIPALCKKAGVPRSDVRGNITSHRARSTIASQLYNAKEPMTLFELQEWLGHSSPSATQHYAKLSPTKLARAYKEAGYFSRNLRAIEVLIDQEVVRNGAAGKQPWKYYDLGHGFCTYDFFEQCPHRMACAKCDFYLAKTSSRALLIDGKRNLLRMTQEMPLAEAEKAAVEDGIEAFEKLLAKLIDVPTPAGTTPRQIGNRLVQIADQAPGRWQPTPRRALVLTAKKRNR